MTEFSFLVELIEVAYLFLPNNIKKMYCVPNSYT